MNRDIVTIFLIETISHQLGIVPIKTIHHDYEKILTSLPPDEARVSKRKFRKLWRKCMKGLKEEKRISPTYLVRSLGSGAKVPTRTQKNTRKAIVAGHILNKLVAPMRSNLLM